jgi:hypothetical protein
MRRVAVEISVGEAQSRPLPLIGGGIVMSPRDWFGFGVRFAGLWCACKSAFDFMGYLDVRLGFSKMRVSPLDGYESSPDSYLVYAAGYGALALYFLRATEHLTRLTFHDSTGNGPTEHGEQDAPRAAAAEGNAVPETRDPSA